MANYQLRELTDQEWAEIARLSNGELLQNIALARGRGALGHDSEKQGSIIYTNTKNILKDAICHNQVIRDLSLRSQQGSSPLLLSALADVVSGYLTGVAGASFCVLLLRDGLPEFCTPPWEARQ